MELIGPMKMMNLRDLAHLPWTRLGDHRGPTLSVGIGTCEKS
jgi:hypothetical protein